MKLKDITGRTAMHQFGVMVLTYIAGLVGTFLFVVLVDSMGATDKGTFIAANIGLRGTTAWIGHNLARWKNNGAELPMTIFSAIFGWFIIGGYALFSHKKALVVDAKAEVIEQIDLYLEPEWEGE
jgi:hypothetical protein